jgi:RNA 2',3'-cyclic 3'-phosphodiesterase
MTLTGWISGMLRLFVGIGFPPELKLRLSLLCSGVAGARWVDPGNFHLTLRFIGETGEDVAADVDDALSRLRARRFTLQLEGTGVFGGSDQPRSLWVGVERDRELIALRDKIEQALIRAGLAPEPRKYAPHVTLARLHNPPVEELSGFLAAHARFRADPLPVENFSLIASLQTKAGPVYEDQADYPLLH